MVPSFKGPSGKVPLWDDPDYDPDRDYMRFHLTYEGLMLASNKTKTRADHKQDVRKYFHKQLKKLWEIQPFLSKARLGHFAPLISIEQDVPAIEGLAERYRRGNYKFVPLVIADTSLLCSLDVVFLRPDIPGSIIKSGDIDGRLKTLFDGLTMPGNTSELGKYDTPGEGEEPFFCLLGNDKLISRFSVETDTLLEPTKEGLEKNDFINDVRLVIDVRIQPYTVGLGNVSFG